MTSTKRLRSEASAGAVKSTSSKPQGEIYEKWKKKRHREIGSEYGVGGEDDGGGNRGSPNFKHNSKVKSELRNSSEIRKLKSTRENNKVKNRKRDSSSGGKGKRGGSGKGKRGNGRN